MRCNYLHYEFECQASKRHRQTEKGSEKMYAKEKAANARLFQLKTFTRNERAMQM